MGRSWVTKKRTTPDEISQAITSTVSDINNVRDTETNCDIDTREFRRKTINMDATSGRNLKVMYTKADQFLNKRDDLVTCIADDEPDIIMITEVIPKAQINPIEVQLLQFNSYNVYVNFDNSETNLGASGIRGVRERRLICE